MPDLPQPTTFSSPSKTISLAITGASGAAYGLRLLECLLSSGSRVYFMLSQPAQVVLGMETDISLSGGTSEIEKKLTEKFNAAEGQLSVFSRDQWMAPIASGSGVPDAMVVCPCTTGTLSSIAHGSSKNLIERAADVVLKEQKKLILVVRETPLSVIHLENMLSLAKMGAVMLPANPGFYHQPESIEDLVDFVVARILDQLDITHELLPRWGDSA